MFGRSRNSACSLDAFFVKIDRVMFGTALARICDAAAIPGVAISRCGLGQRALRAGRIVFAAASFPRRGPLVAELVPVISDQ
jgi:hypothetical protein